MLPLRPFVPQAGEKVIMTCRHDIWKLLPTVVIFVLLAAASFLAWWFTRLGGLTLGIAAVALIVLNWGYLDWYFDILVVTDRRITVRRGVIGGVVQQAPLYKIQSISVSRDFSSRLLGVGVLRLDTGAMGGALVYPRLPDADAVSSLIEGLIVAYEVETSEMEMKEIKHQLRSRLHL